MVAAPFVAFRDLIENKSSPLFWEGVMQMHGAQNHVMIARWPKVLCFEPEPLLDPFYARIHERWVLGGIPSRFVAFRDTSENFWHAVKQAGSIAQFIAGLH